MKQTSFEVIHEAEWAEFEGWLAHRQGNASSANRTAPPAFADYDMPSRYRNICQHLAIARDRGYSLLLIDRLHTMVQQGHDVLYRANSGISQRMYDYAVGGFAADLRANLRWVMLSFILIAAPWVAMMIIIRIWPDFVFVVMPQDTVYSLDAMYSDEDSFDYGSSIFREADSNWMMFGFYIYNNISIAFRAFAGGVLAGIGTVYTLIFNGIHMGAAEARLLNIGAGRNFYSFVSGHSAFEIGGIIIAGATGLKLGWSLIAPGRLTRLDALRVAGRSVLGLICGSGVMLFIAAMIEAFWSPHNFPFALKIGVGIFNLLLILAYFTFTGRRHAA